MAPVKSDHLELKVAPDSPEPRGMRHIDLNGSDIFLRRKKREWVLGGNQRYPLHVPNCSESRCFRKLLQNVIGKRIVFF